MAVSFWTNLDALCTIYWNYLAVRFNNILVKSGQTDLGKNAAKIVVRRRHLLPHIKGSRGACSSDDGRHSNESHFLTWYTALCSGVFLGMSTWCVQWHQARSIRILWLDIASQQNLVGEEAFFGIADTSIFVQSLKKRKTWFNIFWTITNLHFEEQKQCNCFFSFSGNREEPSFFSVRTVIFQHVGFFLSLALKEKPYHVLYRSPMVTLPIVVTGASPIAGTWRRHPARARFFA